MGEDVCPLEVRFRHSKPAQTERHAEVFRGPLAFNCAEHALVLERHWLQVPLPESDPELLRMHTAQADQRLHAMNALTPVERVKMILDASGHFNWDRDHMARRLHMSRRTLQRQLAKHDTTFQALFDGYRHGAALTLLQDPQIQTVEVGHLLGFSEPSTFYRAFKRWEGIAPGTYRKRLIQ